MPAAPVTFPLGPPSISGNLITVDQALANPTVITREIAQLAQQRFFASRVFSDAGGVEGGAVLYELPPSTATDLFAERGVQEVEPGAEFPIMTFLRGVPVLAKPKKIGGKFPVTREARKRNSVRTIQRAMVQTANTIALTLDAQAVAVLNAAITGNSRQVAGQSWSTAAGVTNLNASGTNQPIADLLAARQTVELEMRGHTLDSIIIHPNQELSLGQIAARAGTTIDAILATAGINNWYSSPRVTPGTAILYEAGAVGGWANEFPLAEETWYEPEEQSDWYQWSVSPAMFVDDPYALEQLTGIA
jgi:hypothetical protein